MKRNKLHRRYFILSAITSAVAFLILKKGWSTGYTGDDSKKSPTLGLIGGTSWHSTIEYYTYLNEIFNQQHGNRVNPALLIYNLNQKQINDLQALGKWNTIAKIYKEATQKLLNAGATNILLCSNTAHRIFNVLEQEFSISILHIADATAAEANKLGLKKVGLLGTPYTMEQDFLKDRLQQKFNLEVFIPDKSYHMELGRIIYDELSKGDLNPTSKKFVIQQMNILKEKGAEGIILGCTEFPLLIKHRDYSLPLLNTTLLHCKYAINYLK